MKDKPILLLNKLTHIFFRELDAMSSQRMQEIITGQNMMVIGYLVRNQGDVYQKDLEAQFSVRRSTISKILRLMEEKGMITRTAVSADARLKKIELTEKGWKAHEVSTDCVQILEEKMYRGLSVEEQETLMRILRKMEKNLEGERR